MGAQRAVVCLVCSVAFGCGSPAPGKPDAGAAPNRSTTVVVGNGWEVTSTDERGVPRFVWATTRHLPAATLSRADAARVQLARTNAYGVTTAALATLEVMREVPLPSGASVTTFRHRV